MIRTKSAPDDTPKTLAKVVIWSWILLPFFSLLNFLAPFKYPNQASSYSYGLYKKIPLAFKGWLIWLVLNTIFLFVFRKNLSSIRQKSSVAILCIFLLFVLYVDIKPSEPMRKAPPPSSIRPI